MVKSSWLGVDVTAAGAVVVRGAHHARGELRDVEQCALDGEVPCDDLPAICFEVVSPGAFGA